jgi:hypothetical protein
LLSVRGFAWTDGLLCGISAQCHLAASEAGPAPGSGDAPTGMSDAAERWFSAEYNVVTSAPSAEVSRSQPCS